MSIPVAIVDEHNEAFYIWHMFIDRGFINPTANYLLHIDHHDDMESGGYNWNFDAMPQNAAEARNFTDKCLGIADFIIPAVYQGIFNTVHIMKNLIPVKITDTKHFIRRSGESRLDCKDYIPFIHSDRGYKVFTRRDGGLNADDTFDTDNLILDIDLDYFCWDNSLKSTGDKRLEITEAAYMDYVSNKNHPFRIFPRKIVYVDKIDDKYYLIYDEHLPRNIIVDEERIIKRIDRLIQYIIDVNINPKAIDICRSSYSGYLPRERARFVEETFIERLGCAMDVVLIEN